MNLGQIYRKVGRADGGNEFSNTLYSAGHEICRPGQNYGPRVRPYQLVHFVLSGRGMLQIDGHDFHISGGDAFLIPAGQVSYYEASREEPWVYAWVNFLGIQSQTYMRRIMTAVPEGYVIRDLPAARLGYHPHYLTRIFREYFGIAPKQYLTDLKLKKACSLLCSTRLPVAVVAESLGFENALAFSRLFKREFGQSPRSFRCSSRGEPQENS